MTKAPPEKARHLLDALLEGGIETASLTNVDDLLANEIAIFKDKVRIDVQTSPSSIAFEDVRSRKETGMQPNLFDP